MGGKGRGVRQGWPHAVIPGALLIAAALATPGAAAPPQLAQAAAPRNFSIPSQPLAEALTQFGRQSGMQVSAAADLVRGIASPGVSGALTPQEALGRLLAGTGVTYRLTSANTALLERAVQVVPAPGATQLDPVRVEGAAPAHQGTIDSLPPAYAGGHVARGGRLGVMGNGDFMETPFASVAFTDQFKQDIQALSVSDVLRYSVSVQAAQVGTNTNTDAMYMRGFWGGSSYATVDGLNGLAFRQPSLEPVERVELLLGASAFLNGQPYAVGGTINLVPKRAGDEPLTRFGVQYLSDSIFGGIADVSRRFGPAKEFGIRVNGAYSDGETAIEGTDRQSDVASVAVDYRGETVRVTADYIRHTRTLPAEAWFGLDPGVPVPRAEDARRDFQQTWPRYDADYQLAMTRAEWDLAPSWTISAAYGMSWLENSRETQVYYLTDAAGTLQTGWANTEISESTAYSGEVSLRGEFTTGPLRHRARIGAVRFGAHGRGGWIDTPGVQLTSNIYAPVRYPKPALNPSSLPPLDDSDTETIAAFLGDEIGIFDNRVLLIAGGRYIRYESNWYDGTTGIRGGGYEESAVTPAVGLVVRPWTWLSLYANRVEALEPGEQVWPPAANAGAMTPPLKSNQVEVGAKLDLGDFAVTAAFFRIERPYNYLDAATNTYGPNGEQVNHGVELSVFGEPVRGLRVYGGVSVIDAELKRTAGGTFDGKTAPGVPSYNLTAYLDWDVPGLPGLAVSGGLLRAGDSYNDEANEQTVPGWTRFDAGVRYDAKVVGRRAVLRFNVDNLTDETYFYSERSTLYFAPGRTFRVSATADF